MKYISEPFKSVKSTPTQPRNGGPCPDFGTDLFTTGRARGEVVTAARTVLPTNGPQS